MIAGSLAVCAGWVKGLGKKLPEWPCGWPWVRWPGLYRVLLGALLMMPCLVACAGTDSSRQDIRLHLTHPEDLQRLADREDSLALTPEKVAFRNDFQTLQNIPVPNIPEYRLGPSDVIEVVYHIRYGRTDEAYQLEVQDKISITFPYHPQFSTTVLIRTDGKITVPLIGDVRAESLTPTELAAVLNREYSKYVRSPAITVALEQFNIKIDELKRAITTAPRGQSKIAPIAPDGRISFPIIGQIMAEGLTLAQLEEMVNDQYKEYLRNLQVTLILLEIHHPRIYLVGEVQRPGAYEITSRINLLDAIALAGGYKTSACLTEVVVLRNDGLEKPLAFKVDLQSMLEYEGAYLNLVVKPADIIYVPKTPIDAFDDVVAKIFTRGLYAVLPFQTVFSINYDINGLNVR